MALHDLALALGGMTVAELKNRMSLAELNDWGAYMKVNGPLSPILRNDAAIARLAVSMSGKGAKMEHFMPWPKREEPEENPMVIFEKIRAIAAQNRKS